MTLNQEAMHAFEQADGRLNKVYGKLLSFPLDAADQKKLRRAQRAWIAFRDAEAEYESKGAEGGSMSTLVYYSTAARLTEQRIKDLEAIVEEEVRTGVIPQ